MESAPARVDFIWSMEDVRLAPVGRSMTLAMVSVDLHAVLTSSMTSLWINARAYQDTSSLMEIVANAMCPRPMMPTIKSASTNAQKPIRFITLPQGYANAKQGTILSIVNARNAPKENSIISIKG